MDYSCGEKRIVHILFFTTKFKFSSNYLIHHPSIIYLLSISLYLTTIYLSIYLSVNSSLKEMFTPWVPSYLLITHFYINTLSNLYLSITVSVYIPIYLSIYLSIYILVCSFLSLCLLSNHLSTG